jgi:HK97 family phage major capsid protein
LVVESAEYEARSGRGFDGVEVRNLLTSTSAGTSGSNLFVPVGTPFLSQGGLQRRRPFVRDLLSVQQTGLASVPYIRELNEVTNEAGATTVSEASAKPEVTMEFQPADAPIRKIAAWVQATNEALDDAPTLQGYIDTRLAYMLMIEEESQIIAGNGTAPNISGILDNSPQTDTGELYTVIGTAAGKIEAVDGYPDGVVANPVDFWAAVTDRHATQFDGDGNGSAPFGTPVPTVWGLPVIRSRALTSGDALVGAWKLGATLFEKQGVTIRSTDSHASLFTSNTVVILAEERVGLAIHRPNWFVDCTVTAPS